MLEKLATDLPLDGWCCERELSDDELQALDDVEKLRGLIRLGQLDREVAGKLRAVHARERAMLVGQVQVLTVENEMLLRAVGSLKAELAAVRGARLDRTEASA